VAVDELMTKYSELSRVREELVQQLDAVTEDEKLARANVNATEQANCALPSCISSNNHTKHIVPRPPGVLLALNRCTESEF